MEPGGEGGATPGSPGEVWDREHRALTVGLLLTVSFSAFEAMAVTTVMPVAVDEMGGLALYGWLFSAFVLASLVGISFAGSSADHRGAAPPFAAGAALFVAGLLGAGLAPSTPLLVATRALQGLGAGALSAVAYVAIGRGYGSAARPRMIALLSTAWVVPGLVGPAIAGAVADHLGWRWVFLGLIPPTAVGATLALASLRRLGARPATPEDGAAGESVQSDRRADALALATGAGAFLAALERRATPLLAAALAVVGIALAARALGRLLPPGTLRARAGQPAAVAVMGLLGFVFFGAEAFIPLALSEVRGLSATLAGLPLSVAALAWTAGAWLQDREAARRSHRLLIAGGFAVIGLGVLGVVGVLAPAVPTWVAGVSWGLAALGMGVAYSTTALVILEHAEPGREGEASAALQLANLLGTALGTGIGGALLDAVTHGGRSIAAGIRVVDLTMVAAAALGLWAARGIPPSRQPAQTARDEGAAGPADPPRAESEARGERAPHAADAEVAATAASRTGTPFRMD